jgi:hypothetical protein
MRENLTYGLMWRGVETRISVPGATPRPYQPTSGAPGVEEANAATWCWVTPGAGQFWPP